VKLETAEVVIIGGGVMGAATAYHLARLGLKPLLLESDRFLGTGSTGQNAGGFRHQFSTAINIELSKLSIGMLARFEEELGQAIDLNYCGYLFLLDDEEDVRVFGENVALQHRHGVATEWLTPDEIGRRAPLLDLSGVLAGTFYERDGLVDPNGVLQGLVNGARSLGAELRTSAPVTDVTVRNGRIVGVGAGSTKISTPSVVIAAGAWSGEIGRMAGVELPIVPIRRQIAVTSPLAQVDRSFPFVIDFGRSLYFHYESGGILTGMSNHAQQPGFDITVDQEWRLVHFENAAVRLPLLETAEIRAEWAGLYEVTPDDQPILGRVPDVEGLYTCTGFSGHGLMHGPAAGLLVAEEIVHGSAQTLDITPLRLRTFDGRDAGEYNVV
jgi:sarcosine oxidase, subunit beta